MKLPPIPFTNVDWTSIDPDVHAGTSGTAAWRTIERDGLRVRIVEYGAGWVSDHFCPRGHVLLVLDGELHLERQDGSVQVLRPGMGFIAGDDTDNMHSTRAPRGARAFIVD